MNECPHCKGAKEFRVQESEYWEEPPRYRTEACRTCSGTGKVSNLQLAVHKARGGDVPIRMVGF